MSPDGLHNMQNKILKFYLLMIAVLCLLGLVQFIGSFTTFNTVCYCMILCLAAMEAAIYRFKLWERKCIYAMLLFIEAGFYAFMLVYEDSPFLKGIILTVFIALVIRIVILYDFMEAHARRIVIGVLFGISTVFILIKLFVSYGENYNEVFGITCLVFTTLLLVIFMFECLSDASNYVQEKLFEQRRLADSTREANEALKLQKEKIDKVNELLAVQKLKLESAYRQMHDMAIRDGLTGVYNRGYLNKVFGDLCREAAEAKHPLAVALFDIDHFKMVNDTYGHLFGDIVIIAVAKIAQETAEKYNGIAARYGGEEFVIVFPRKNMETCIGIVEEMKQNISDLDLDYHDIAVRIHVSVGLTAYPQTCPEPLELLNHADLAMYFSKESGRNRITIDSESVRASVRMKPL